MMILKAFGAVLQLFVLASSNRRKAQEEYEERIGKYM